MSSVKPSHYGAEEGKGKGGERGGRNEKKGQMKEGDTEGEEKKRKGMNKGTETKGIKMRGRS